MMQITVDGLKQHEKLSTVFTVLQVILGIMMPATILFLEFKSKEELQLMPQTVEEHIQELEDSESDSSFDSTDEDDGENHSIAVGLAGLAMNSPRV